MSQEIHVFEDKIELARYFGQLLTELTWEEGPKYIALSGGTTPQSIFDVLADEFRNKIRWERLRLFWVDERCVSPTDNESNYRMTNEHLISGIGIPSENIYRVKGELSPEEALPEYIKVIKAEVPLKNGWPVFDLTVLGMGDDGHTASIFPHQIDLWKSPEICAIGNHPVTGQARITLTGKAINSSRQIVFLVTGENKAEKIEQIISYDRNSSKYPAKMVDRSKTIWLLDEAAASLLNG
jgi:6-phosphogluconolactonase